MKNITIVSGSADIALVNRLSSLNKNEEIHITLAQKESFFSQKAKEDVIENLCTKLNFKNVTIQSQTIDTILQQSKNQITNTLLFFSNDYTKMKAAPDIIALSPYEKSIIFHIGLYHRAVQNNKLHIQQDMKEKLSSYLECETDNRLIDVYLSNEYIKQESLEYIATVQKPEKMKTVDMISVVEKNGEPCVVLGERKDYPKGIALLGGMIDYKNQQPGKQSDMEIAQHHNIPDITIVTQLREFIEEGGGYTKEEVETLQIHYNIENKEGVVMYTAKTDRIKVGILIHEKAFEFIEDPSDPDYIPSDSRFVAATSVRQVHLFSGTLQAGDDIGEINLIPLKKLKDTKFAMDHHRDIVKSYFPEYFE